MSNVMEEVHLTTIKPKNEVLLLAQEISFAKVLACNDKRLRDRGLKRLKKWFMARSQGSEFSKDDFMRIWKGLFYCMWMSDKPLIQEELAEEISHLVHSFATFKASLLFVETFYTSLAVEWFGIDQLRLDKFMMLVRRMLRQSLELVAGLGWPVTKVQQLADIYHRTLASAPLGLSMHLTELFCEELAKVGQGKLSSDTILQFIKLFACLLATLKDGRLISQITRCVFLHLIRQTELGVEHQLKFSAWKEFGFPGGDVDAGERIEVDSDSDSEQTTDGSDGEGVEEERVGVDARAGKVDVLLPQLDFDPTDLITELVRLRNDKQTTTRARKTLIQLITKFESLAAGKYPLGLHKVDLPNKVDKKKEIMRAAKRLYVEERKLINDSSDSEGANGKTRLKKPVKKTNRTSWEVSDANESSEHSDSTSSTLWQVSESTSTNKQPRKRKVKDEDESDTSNNRTKRTRRESSFSVSDSKENSFSTPVASTPKSANKKNVLKKTTSDNQNLSLRENNLSPNESNTSKIRNKLRKRNKNHISDVKSGKEDASSENVKETTNQRVERIEGPNSSTSGDRKTTQMQLNVSTSDKNNGWGGEWDEPLQDGEYEMFIPNKKYVEKRKSLGLPYPEPSFVQKSTENVTPVNRIKNKLLKKSSTPNSQKKVEFNLSANCSQDFKEYTRKVKSSKKQVPFDASKKPVQGLLKNSTPSPINPFYKKKLKLLISPKTL